MQLFLINNFLAIRCQVFKDAAEELNNQRKEKRGWSQTWQILKTRNIAAESSYRNNIDMSEIHCDGVVGVLAMGWATIAGAREI